MKVLLLILVSFVCYSYADLRDDLLAKAAAIEAEGKVAVDLLKSENRAQQAQRVQAELDHLQRIADQLKAATSDQEIRRLEAEIQQLENRLQVEINFIEGSSIAPPRSSVAPSSARSSAAPSSARSSVSSAAPSSASSVSY